VNVEFTYGLWSHSLMTNDDNLNQALRTNKMKSTIIKKALLENLPSASGVEIIDGIIHIIGDDSPYLYCLDHTLKVIDKVELFATENFESGRIPKKIKPDLECMSQLTINNNKYIITMGSGSKENRDKGFLIKLPTKYNKKYFVQEVSFKGLYDLLRNNDEIVSDGKLNLEAAATSDEHFILFNRANKSGKNVVLYFKLEEFLVYVTENQEMIPFPKIYTYDLPSLNGVPGGFSGASVINEKLFFTASVEDTADAVEDGEVYGSFVGWMDVLKMDYLRGGSEKSVEMKDCSVIEEDGKIFLGKVESICLYEKESDQEYIALAITDNDLGASEILMIEVKL
jgi:hypothetical protein